MSDHRHHIALVLISTVLALSACAEDPVRSGPLETPTIVEPQQVEFHILNHTPWALDVHVEGDAGSLALGRVDARSRGAFVVELNELGGRGSFLRLRAEGDGHNLYSEMFRADLGVILASLERDGGVEVEPHCDWRTNECRY